MGIDEVMAYIVMAYIVMAYKVTAAGRGLGIDDQ